MSMLERQVSRRSLLRAAAAAAAGGGALVVVGCGDGGSSSTKTVALTQPPPISTKETVASPVAARKPVWSEVRATGGPAARRDHSLTFNPNDGLIYVFAGRANGTADNELWSFDPKSSLWQQRLANGPQPDARFGHDAFYDRSKKRLVVALGQGNGGFFNDVWAYDASGWRQLDVAAGDKPEIRYGAGSAHDEAASRLLISHGFTDHGRYNDTWAFDLLQDKWSVIPTSGAVPIKRCLTRCLWLPAPKQMLLFGGQTDDNPFLGDLWTLDTQKGAWAEQKPSTLPGPRNLYGASLDQSGARWFITSGNTKDGPIAETWTYDLAAAAWSLLEPAGDLPPARYSADAAIAGSKLYLFGGHDGNAEIADMWALDIAV